MAIKKERKGGLHRMAAERKSDLINTALLFSRTLLLMKKIVKLEITANSTHAKIMPKDYQKNYYIPFYQVYQAYMGPNIK